MDDAGWDCASGGILCAGFVPNLRQLPSSNSGPGGRAVNYPELPDAVWTSLREYFNLDCTEEDLDRMRHVTQFDAKNPSLFFTPKAAQEKKAVNPLIRELSDALDRADLRRARGVAKEAERSLIEDSFVVITVLDPPGPERSIGPSRQPLRAPSDTFAAAAACLAGL